MKFRDPKTGEILENICVVYERFCSKNERCSIECPLAFAKSCSEFVWVHQREAARLMEYDVIESEGESEDSVEICQKVKEVNMKKKDKPRLAEVLGVEVGERFMIKSIGVRFFVDEDGIPKIFDGDSGLDVEGISIYYAINHPERIIRAPRLTEAELAICKAVGAKWVSRDKNGDDGTIDIWREKPLYGEGIYNQAEEGDLIAHVFSPNLFPSVHPGECICVEEAGSDD